MDAQAAGHVRPLRESQELEKGLCAAGFEDPVLENRKVTQGHQEHGGVGPTQQGGEKHAGTVVSWRLADGNAPRRKE